MGNNTPSSALATSTLLQKYTITTPHPSPNLLSLHCPSTNTHHLLKSLTTNDITHHTQTQHLASLKKLDDNPYILKLQSSLFHKQNNYCTVQYKSYLIFEKPFKDLRTQMTERKGQENSFDADELMSVIETGVLGLKYLGSIRQPLHQVSSATIYLSNTGIILLADPWVCQESYQGGGKQHWYPAPEVGRELGWKGSRDGEDWVAAGLYSLGVVVLELYYLEYMDCLYEGGEGVNEKMLKERVQGVQFEEVRRVVEELVSNKRRRLMVIPEMERYADSVKEELMKDVKAESNVVYNKIPESSIGKPGALISKLNNSGGNSQGKVKKEQKDEVTQKQPVQQQMQFQKTPESPKKYEGLVFVSPEKFNRVEYHPSQNYYPQQPQYQPQPYYQPSHYNKYHPLSYQQLQPPPQYHSQPTQSHYLPASPHIQPPSSILTSQHISSHHHPIYNSISLHKDPTNSSLHHQQLSPSYKQSQNTYHPSSLIFSKTASNTNFPPSPSLMSLSNFHSASNSSNQRQSPYHNKYIPSLNMSGSSNLITSFNGVGQSINSNHSSNPSTSTNKSFSSLVSYPKAMNQSYYQQDHYIQPKPSPTTMNLNMLAHYLPSQIIHTSAVSQVGSDGYLKPPQLNQLMGQQEVVSKEVSEVMECSFRSPIGVVEQHSSIDEGKMLGEGEVYGHSRGKSDDEYLLRDSGAEGDGIQEAIEKEKRELEKQREEDIVQTSNLFQKPDEDGQNQDIRQSPKWNNSQNENTEQNQQHQQSSPPAVIRNRKLNSTIIQVSDSQNKSQGYGEIQYLGSSSVSDKFKIDSERFVIQHYGEGTRYQGEKLHGKKHGEGKYVYEDGAYVEGLWKNDQLNGPAKLYYSTGKLAYDGEYYMGQFHGFGKVYNAEPEPVSSEGVNYRDFSLMVNEWQEYQGEIKQEQKCGFGRLKYSNGDVYEGEFNEDKADGKGIFYIKKGGSVKGIWKNNKLVEII